MLPPRPPRSDVSGILAVDKPSGWTSFDVVAVCRRAFGVRRIGHGGTLDPLATGVLPILVGAATRWSDRLHEARKCYAATIVFGRETTTDDAGGEVRREAPPPTLPREALDAALERFRGEIDQVPPAYAAVKVGGRRAYALARAGEPATLAARRVRIDRLAIAAWSQGGLRAIIVCSSGTYVRALARDIGRAVGSAAHLGGLVRVAVGALDREEAITIDRIRAADHDDAAAMLRPVGEELLALDERYLTAPAEDLLARAAP